ncbi:MAG: HEAT repeat domain-containing protein [Caldilineaceae bacterium]
MKRSEWLDAWLAAIAQDNDEEAERLTLQGTATAEPALLSQLQQGNPDQRWWAARALAHCGTGAAIPALLAALEGKNAELRAVAALALGALYVRKRTQAPSPLAAVATLLADDDGMVRQAAADALAQCGDDAIGALVNVLRNSEHQGARSRAAYALRKIGSEAAAPALFRCLNDPNYLVHTYAHEALDEMGLLENVLVTM